MLAKTKIAGLVVVLMTFSIPMVYADNDMGNKGPMHQGGGWHQAKEAKMMGQILNLSEAQVKQLEDLKQKRRDAMKAVFNQMKTNRDALEAEIVKAVPDMTKISGIQTQIKTIQSQMVDDHLNFILDIKKILTPEQFAGYMALEKEEDLMTHEGHKGEMHKHWGDRDHEGEKGKISDGQK